MVIRFALGLLLLCTLSACSPRSGSVQGSVSYLDKPVPRGEVILLGPDGQPLPPAALDVNGRFELKGVVYGNYHVAVLQRPTSGKTPSELRQEWKAKGESPPPDVFFIAGVKSSLPARYADHATSGLTVTVTQPITQCDIRLVDDP